jgi:periplasmic protein TonB
MILVQQRYLSNGPASRFSGLIVVVGLHLGLVFALMIGLKPNNDLANPGKIEVKTVEEPQVKVEPPPPPQVDYVPLPVEAPTEPLFNVPVDVPVLGNVITPVKAEPPPVAQKAPPTAANSLKKGLSAPSYPSESKKLGEEGAVGLALYLNEEGKVQDARVETSSGFPRLDEAAVKHAARSWKFEPCTDDKKPVACWHRIKFRFQLKDA